jgi:hypothetical protein
MTELVASRPGRFTLVAAEAPADLVRLMLRRKGSCA